MSEKIPRLPDEHLGRAREIVADKRTKQKCKVCYDRGYIGANQDNMLVPCSKCVDVEGVMEGWRVYVAETPALKELYGDYFEDIIPQYINPFIASKNIFDIVEPSVSIPYKDTFILDTMLNTKSINECLITKKSDEKLKLEAYLRARKLSPDFTLLEFKHNFMCTWELAIFILNDYGINITIKDLQELLQQTYSSYNRSEKMQSIVELWK